MTGTPVRFHDALFSTIIPRTMTMAADDENATHDDDYGGDARTGSSMVINTKNLHRNAMLLSLSFFFFLFLLYLSCFLSISLSFFSLSLPLFFLFLFLSFFLSSRVLSAGPKQQEKTV